MGLKGEIPPAKQTATRMGNTSSRPYDFLLQAAIRGRKVYGNADGSVKKTNRRVNRGKVSRFQNAPIKIPSFFGERMG